MMALWKVRCVFPFHRQSLNRMARCYSQKSVSRSVLISQSHDVFENLALEDWLYRNLDVSSTDVLFAWRNSPCVVIGRHQNPWCEANFSFIRENQIPLARRNSGGGAVFHDLGNLCLTYFSTRDEHNRKRNLQEIVDAVRGAFGIDVFLNNRDDITVDGKKVSGTAAKLSSKSAYHHCTLLVSSNRNQLRNSLHNNPLKEHLTTNATQSLPAPVANLQEFFTPDLRALDVITAVGDAFLMRSPSGNRHGNGYQMVRPDPNWFAGIDQLRNDFQSWEWIYGRTPDFTYSRTFECDDISITVKVCKGLINDVMTTSRNSSVHRALQNLCGQRFVDGLIEGTMQNALAYDGNNQVSVRLSSHLPNYDAEKMFGAPPVGCEKVLLSMV